MRRIAGHNIHVVQQNNRSFRLSCVGTRQSCPKVGPTGRVLENSVLNPLLVEDLLEKRCRAHFIARRVGRIDS